MSPLQEYSCPLTKYFCFLLLWVNIYFQLTSDWTALEFASNLQHSGKLRHPTPQFQQFHSFGPVERCTTTLIWEQHKYLHHESDCVGAVDLSSECSGSKASNSLWLDADDSWLLLIARGSSWTTVLDSVPVVGHLWPECRAFNRPSR